MREEGQSTGLGSLSVTATRENNRRRFGDLRGNVKWETVNSPPARTWRGLDILKNEEQLKKLREENQLSELPVFQ